MSRQQNVASWWSRVQTPFKGRGSPTSRRSWPVQVWTEKNLCRGRRAVEGGEQVEHCTGSIEALPALRRTHVQRLLAAPRSVISIVLKCRLLLGSLLATIAATRWLFMSATLLELAPSGVEHVCFFSIYRRFIGDFGFEPGCYVDSRFEGLDVSGRRLCICARRSVWRKNRLCFS
jgi:hypothetical protein